MVDVPVEEGRETMERTPDEEEDPIIGPPEIVSIIVGNK